MYWKLFELYSKSNLLEKQYVQTIKQYAYVFHAEHS